VVEERRQDARQDTAAPIAPEGAPPGAATSRPSRSRSAQDRMRMGPGGEGEGEGEGEGDFFSKLKWPGADGGDGDFFPEGGSDDFDAAAGSLRIQILANANFVQGTLGGHLGMAQRSPLPPPLARVRPGLGSCAASVLT